MFLFFETFKLTVIVEKAEIILANSQWIIPSGTYLRLSNYETLIIEGGRLNRKPPT